MLLQVIPHHFMHLVRCIRFAILDDLVHAITLDMVIVPNHD